MSLQRVHISLREARRFVAEHHRHSEPTRDWIHGVGVALDGQLVGVGVNGNPTSSEFQKRGGIIETRRLCTDGTKNACTFLYSSLANAAKYLGWRLIVTYVLASEPGTSLKAAGWTCDGPAGDPSGYVRPKRPRADVDLFGNRRAPDEDKVRWSKILATPLTPGSDRGTS